MTLSHPHLRNWPLAAVALAIACSASAQVGTTGSTDPATVPGTAVGQTSTTGAMPSGTATDTGVSTGTNGASGSTNGSSYGTTNGSSTNGGSMDTRSGLASDGSMRNGSSSSGWMGRPMYSQGEGNYSIIPYSTQGYVGINAGQPKYDTPCVAGFSCSNRTTSYKLYTGGMFSPFVGGELAYVNMGRVKRGDGRTEAHGINLSLVGRMPLGAVNAFAKVGATYGRTKTSGTVAAITTGTGTEKGWGGSYGLGVGFDVTRASSIVLEWERHDFRFRGLGREHVDSTSLGYVHRF